MLQQLEDRTFTRRRLLAGAGAVGIVGAASAIGFPRPAEAAATSLPSGGGTLVLVTMYGGNDGLNTVVPYGDPAYQAARPTIGYQPSSVLALDATTGLNSKLTGIKALWDAQQVAIVQGVGYDNPSLSHFQSMDIWQTADPNGDGAGWLGRWLDVAGGDPMKAISIGSTLPTALRGTSAAATALTSTSITLPGGTSYQTPYTQLMGPGPDRTGLAAQVAQAGTDLVSVKGTIDGYGLSPVSGGLNLTNQLAIVADLIKAGASTQVYQVSLGSFDTHTDEHAEQEAVLAQLDAGVSSFFQNLQTAGKADDVVLMTYSEFGRRVQQNASGGTDHGTANPLFVIGPAVKAGLHGEQPSLTQLDPNGNLVHDIDFRSVYTTMLQEVVGVDATPFVGGSYPTIDVL